MVCVLLMRMPLESCLGAAVVACVRQGIMQLCVVLIEVERRHGRGVVMQFLKGGVFAAGSFILRLYLNEIIIQMIACKLSIRWTCVTMV